MKKLAVILTISLIVTVSLVQAEDIEMAPMHFGTWTTMGFIHGDSVDANGNSGILDNKPYMRYGAYVALGAAIGERMNVDLLLAAMKWNSLPLTKNSAFTRNQLLSPGLGFANLTYKFGDVESPFLTLKFGDMPYNYSSAKNLGGHLYTAGTYPGYLWGNYWSLIDGNGYNGEGLWARFAMLGGALNIDLTAFIEHNIEPHFDLSPGIVVSYKVGEIIEFGAGAVFSHLISVDEEKTTREDRNNAYNSNGVLTREDLVSPGIELTDSIIVDSTDARWGTNVSSEHPLYDDFLDQGIVLKYMTAEENGTPTSQLEYYTFRGTKVMGRVNVTPIPAFADGLGRTEIYAEATLLGVKDYPFYYEKKSERMPITFGFNLPLPGFSLNAEAEYYNSPFRNHIQNTYEFDRSIWLERPEDFQDENNPAIAIDSHDYSPLYWSVTAIKSVNKALTFKLKFARDHMRTYNFFGNPTFESATKHSDSFYMVFKTELNI